MPGPRGRSGIRVVLVVVRMGPWPDLADFPFELYGTYERIDVSGKPKHFKNKGRDEYLGGRNPGHGCMRV